MRVQKRKDGTLDREKIYPTFLKVFNSMNTCRKLDGKPPLDHDAMLALHEIFLDKMDAVFKHPSRQADDEATVAHYDLIVAMGLDEIPGFLESEMKALKGLSLKQKVHGLTLTVADITAARKRAGKSP